MQSVTASKTSATSTKHWPRMADYKNISREDAKDLVAEFGALYGLNTLRAHGNFMHMTFSSVRNFDNVDLLTAIQFMIDYLFDETASLADVTSKSMLIKRLEAACGPLDKPIALSVDCSHRAFTPARA